MTTQAVFDCSALFTGVLASQGWATQGVVTVSGTYTPLSSDAVVLCNATTAGFTITLADCTQPPYVAGQRYTVIKTDSSGNTVLVQGSGTQTINGGTVTLTTSSAFVSVVFDAVSLTWQIWAQNSTGTTPAGAAGGALTGTYPNPSLAVPVSLSKASATSLLTLTNTTSAPTSAIAQLVAAASGDRSLGIQVTGDGFQRYRVDSTGKIQWGPGNLTQDTNLYRASAGVLQTDQSLVVSGSATVGGVVLPNFAGVFGDGSDSSLNFDGTSTVLGLTPSAGVYTLTRDIFATSIQVGGGGTATTITTAGWRIFAAGTVTNAANGTISAAGNSATTLSNQHGNGAGTSVGALGGGRAGAAGVATGTAGTGTASTGVATNAPGAGGNGSTGTGGAAASAAPSTNTGWLRTPYAVLATALFNSSAVQRVDGGGGGSGGGGDGTNFGGGGGSGGGVVAICAYALVNNGVITAAGGNGGTPTVAAAAGGCGGGGGGAGGLVLTYTLSAVTGSGSISVAGGNGGTKVTNGGTAQNGGNGNSGTALSIVLT